MMADFVPPSFTPMDCALGIFSDAERVMGEPLDALLDFKFLDLLIAIHPGIRTVIPALNRVYFEVDEIAAWNIAVASHGNPESLEILLHISTCNIFNGQAVPEAFRPICVTLLQGGKVGARKSGPSVGRGFGRFFLATSAADYIADAYRFPRTRGDGMEPASAADIVSEAFELRGIKVSFTLIRDWLTNRKHADNRVRADILTHRINESYLLALGVVSARPDWFLGPYGPCGPSPIIGRMT